MLQMQLNLERQGYAIDWGTHVGGAFPPDRRVRVYNPVSDSVVAEGATLEEAYGLFIEMTNRKAT